MVLLFSLFIYAEDRSLRIRVVGFDFVETLVQAGFDNELCLKGLVESLKDSGLTFSREDFLLSYSGVIHKYRYLREVTCTEVSNEIWVADALDLIGQHFEPESELVRRAVDAYFQPYIDSLTPYSKTLSVLASIHRKYSTGLISNFTVARVVHKSLEKLGLTKLLDKVVVSDDVKWRKPHPKIFKEFLGSFDAKPEEVVFIGDSIVHDAYGAKNAGFKTILITGGPNSRIDHRITCYDAKRAEPDFRIPSIEDVPEVLNELEKDKRE